MLLLLLVTTGDFAYSIEPAIISDCGTYRLRGYFKNNLFFVNEGTFSEYRIKFQKVPADGSADSNQMEIVAKFERNIPHSYSPTGIILDEKKLDDSRMLDFQPLVKLSGCR